MQSKADSMPCGISAVEVTPPKLSAATAPAARGVPRSLFVPASELALSPPHGGGKFPKTVRLLKHADFDRVYRTGRRQFSASITVFWLRRGAGPASGPGGASVSAGPRVGFTVSRMMGGSVVRNRIRRRLREAVRLNLTHLLVPQPQPVDVVINPKKSALTGEFSKLKDEVAEAFRAIVKNAAPTNDSTAKLHPRSPR